MTHLPTHPAGQAERRTALFELLKELYAQQLKEGSGNQDYIRSHATPNSILRQIDAFERYFPLLPASGSVLDWGCCHAPDSCMLRYAVGGDLELHGCDFDEPGRYPRFHGYAGLKYRQLKGPLQIPYEPERFDVVIGSGVLEHTAMDGESLKELHRVLKEGGLLVLTFLPNRWSYTEFLARRLGTPSHERLYGRKDALRLLRHHGFKPRLAAYHQFIPAHQMQTIFRHLWRANRVLERTWPGNLLCSNLMLLAERRSVM